MKVFKIMAVIFAIYCACTLFPAQIGFSILAAAFCIWKSLKSGKSDTKIVWLCSAAAAISFANGYVDLLVKVTAIAGIYLIGKKTEPVPMEKQKEK